MFPIHLTNKKMRKPAETLRELLNKEEIVVAPGVYNAAVALLAEKLGFKALYLSGAAITGSLAMPDIGIITLDEIALHARWITRVTKLPLIVDIDTGFGEPVNVMRTVKVMEEIGVAAIQIEDQVLPKKCGHLSGKQLIPPEEMVKKIRAAIEARSDPNFVIIARTDARGVEGLEEAIWRANLYVEAGADVIFPEALTSREEFREFAKKVKAPLLANMTEFGKTPYITVDEFKELGYKIVIFPVTTFRASLKASERVLKVIKNEGTQRNILDELMSRSDFYELINYYAYEEVDKLVAEKAMEVIRRKTRGD